jgi:hypothetical protein
MLTRMKKRHYIRLTPLEHPCNNPVATSNPQTDPMQLIPLSRRAKVTTRVFLLIALLLTIVREVAFGWEW